MKCCFQERDLLQVSEEEIRQVRGNKIAMIFQDPMTSLNPVLTIGRQISEALELHMGMDKNQARERTIESAWSWSISPKRATASTIIRTSSRAACASG